MAGKRKMRSGPVDITVAISRIMRLRAPTAIVSDVSWCDVAGAHIDCCVIHMSKALFA
jgi:hypothetical protein